MLAAHGPCPSVYSGTLDRVHMVPHGEQQRVFLAQTGSCNHAIQETRCVQAVRVEQHAVQLHIFLRAVHQHLYETLRKSRGSSFSCAVPRRPYTITSSVIMHHELFFSSLELFLK
ncbi:hypothetical protein L798_12099 [Zootermopsis nevadensis]|uniref:Uncharacterized protein n=1 Tax=Zootermopsis nevadensis TaxID=136037 RepID=A0A067QUY0_ZOONE|nr:hypothetical protein L798_12099 [Zootermopsis nevadensis]